MTTEEELVYLREENKELLLDMNQATERAREQVKLWLDPLEVVDWEQDLSKVSLGIPMDAHKGRPYYI